jgi:hypothetical protein
MRLQFKRQQFQSDACRLKKTKNIALIRKNLYERDFHDCISRSKS